MASQQAEAMKKLYREWKAEMARKPDMGIEEVRDLFDHWGDLTTDPVGVDYTEVDAGGVTAMWAVPKGCAEDRVLLCTHGGGYAAGSMYSHRKVYAHFAKAVGCKSLILHFRRAPEFTHPAQVNDTLAAYEWLLAQGYQARHIASLGDSAGGALATAVCLAARDKGLPQPAASMPISPWYDLEAKGASTKTNADKDCLASEALTLAMAATFLGGASPHDPLASPLHADLRGLAPTYIQVGGDECLLDDATRFETLARAAGVDIKCEVWPEMQHCFQIMAGRAPEANDAIARYAAWVRPKLGL